jgi:hypothetical protein
LLQLLKTEIHKESDMARMKAAQIAKAGGDFEMVERDIPEPGAKSGSHKS